MLHSGAVGMWVDVCVGVVDVAQWGGWRVGGHLCGHGQQQTNKPVDTGLQIKAEGHY